jgi:DNA polymerase IV
MDDPGTAAILHADLDAFYASVEQLLDPSLRDQPIAVGGSATGGVVLAASYEARKFGVSGGMSGRIAKSLCPSIRFVGGHFEEYQRLGDQVIETFRDVTPLVERISIDEAFLDVRGAIHLFGSPTEIAQDLRARVRNEIGLPLSIGVASTKHLAKVASQVAKPDGLCVVPTGTERAFLEPLPVGLLWGVGRVTEQKLHGRGIHTIGQLADTEPNWINSMIGTVTAETLIDRANNRDPRHVRTERIARSVGAQSACGREVPTTEFLTSTFSYLADRVTRRLRSKSLEARTLTVRIRFRDLTAITRSHTFDEPTAELLQVCDACVSLTRAGLDDHPSERVVSLLGLSLSNLSDACAPRQLALQFVEPRGRDAVIIDERGRAADAAIDKIRERFGNEAINVWAARNGSKGVDDGFRKLVER